VIAELVQTVSGFSCNYALVVNGETVGEAYQKDNVLFGGTIVYRHSDGREYSLVYDQAKQLGNISKPYYERVYIPYDIRYMGDQTCGSIVQMRSQGSFFKRYDYFAAELGGGRYSLFAVGMGNNGKKFPIYRGSEQVALIEKDNVVYNNLDSYKMFVLYDSDVLITALYCLYIDTLMFSNRGKKVIKGKEISYDKTTIKELNSKYDPDFVKRPEFAGR
jgi:hypothetical protein